VQAIDTCETTELNPTGAVNYMEYRRPGQNVAAPSIEVEVGPGGAATFNYFQNVHLVSDGSNLDIRDFGWRAVSPVTGSMSGSSTTPALNSPADFRVGDQIIVEIGGEAGAGARNTIGVGGVTPVLNYANKAAMKADTSQPNPTYAYLGTTARFGSGMAAVGAPRSLVAPTISARKILCRWLLG